MNHLLDNIFSLNGILALVANLGAFAVMWLQGSKVRAAWLLAIVIQLLWAWFYCRTGALLMLFVIAAKQGLNIRALVKWRKA